MEITEVRVKLVQDNTERLRAFCSVTFDGEYVVRDLKIIEGTNGLFVAMPSRKLTDRCPKCRSKNHLRAKFCNECGAKLNENRAGRDSAGRTKLHADVAHPINARCRERIQNAIVEAYEQESERAKEPGYKPPKLDEDDYEGSDYEELVAELKRDRGAARQAPKTSAAPSPPPQDEDQPEPAEGEEPSEPAESEEPSEPAESDDEFSAGIL
ncbi:MAG TPA: SpoVG family protein [Phycisphaerae bacterium]|nr:SpoVG family protein [Phycisphaerae bacterium]